ncbi:MULTISPECIES: efflux RND transporter periplasmic adaptor subunit [unclassified Vibrio]|uniref:Efflux RND transporter periplasmic adaptor subunit n=1 Tax=Vibrio sp. HB236076 TaxID=3232307 RepID=A0AB39HCE9_9VIBR|nr:efflux RND transporter periplasmic adaptor subunit [Vibrio sp. HB161653]MDP5255158.1 efflux RND transporter periplasmic adaptor subunit [Vibrio sp. HB161653]
MAKGSTFFRYSLIAIGLTAVLTGCQPEASDQAAASSQQQPATPVDVIKVTQSPLTLTSSLPGRTTAYRTAQVRPQVQGIILKRLFVEGSMVEKGDVLYQLDDATYKATLASAKATLAQAQANLTSAEYDAKRYARLIKTNAVSQQDNDEAQATYKAALATVEAAKAEVNSAQINLGYTSIKAPISGRIGRSSVTEGALVTANQTDSLATIYQLDPLYVDLSQPSNQLLKLRQSAQGEEQQIKGIKVFLDDGTPIEQTATLQFAEVNVNETTGTVNVRAILPNPNNTLLPGLFVRAQVPTEKRSDAITVPMKAVSRDSRGQAHVFVVTKDNTVEDRVIVANSNVGTQWVVDSGLTAGEQIVISGLQKIKAGASVAPNLIEESTQEN